MHKLHLTNTLTKQKELFTPIDANLVKMYVCGPTVYESPHIGNARSVIVYDILFRILVRIYGSNEVLYVRNITDVDDKIIDRALKDNILPSEITIKMTEVFHHDMKYLHCLKPNIEPKATEHIQEMIAIIEKLILSKHAYVASDHVYFDVSKHKEYCNLSGRTLNEMIPGIRIDIAENKKHPADFVLWKPADESGIKQVNFESPWGLGRPGWHIECSAMSCKYLGENFDIHGGGADLIFPHHTNEIAQSTAAFPNSHFANYWVHNGFLTVMGEKMSKSLGNFITVQDLINKKIAGEVIRLVLLGAHYRKPLDFNDTAITQATKTINYWYRALYEAQLDINNLNEKLELPNNFFECLLDDLNMSLAIKLINDYAKLTYSSKTNNEKKKYALSLLACAQFIGLLNKTTEEWFEYNNNDDDDINILIQKRQQAKLDKNWVEADRIRLELADQYVVLEDKQDGTTSWYRRKV